MLLDTVEETKHWLTASVPRKSNCAAEPHCSEASMSTSPLEFPHASGYARFGKHPSTNNMPHVSSTFIRRRCSAKLVRAGFPRIRLEHVGSARSICRS